MVCLKESLLIYVPVMNQLKFPAHLYQGTVIQSLHHIDPNFLKIYFILLSKGEGLVFQSTRKNTRLQGFSAITVSFFFKSTEMLYLVLPLQLGTGGRTPNGIKEKLKKKI